MCIITSAFLCNEPQCNRDDLTLIKYTDDLVLISSQMDTNSSTYFEYIKSLVQWLDNSHLQLNFEKTKELCCGNQNRAGTAAFHMNKLL